MRELWISLDGGSPRLMRLELSGYGHVPVGTVTRGRVLMPYGRSKLADPANWIDLEVIEITRPESIGGHVCYAARKRSEVAP
jgi:hypothetical protein